MCLISFASVVREQPGWELKWGLRWGWLLALPLVVSGCGDSGAEQARELRTQLDEAQVQIEAQAARIASLEHDLATATRNAGQHTQRLQTVQGLLTARTRQLQALRQQRQALLIDQRNLRQALTQAQAAIRRFNQQLLLIGQQNSFLRQRVGALDNWIRQQSSQARNQSRELASLRDAMAQIGTVQHKLDKVTAERDRLGAKLSRQEIGLSRLNSSRLGLQKQIRQLKKELTGIMGNALKLSNRIGNLQRARGYLTDKLATAGEALKQNNIQQTRNLRRLNEQLGQQRGTIEAGDRQHQQDQQTIRNLESKLASLAERDNATDPELNKTRRKLSECQRQAQQDAARISTLRNTNTSLGKMSDTNLKQIGELMQKLSACPAQ